ncbi:MULTISPECIES: preprotein translocase [Nocardiaceae]|jgi:sec-independent protein translocase protein TatB|uniref:preprotein translocase n=1 Tax=Nocardiaceae TaxID=85025 RepID=UPI00055B13F3|nr:MULTISPECIES: preprotein translocase [Rhodococcus]OZF06365.1 preprotein translocase [Rhodococcus sp. 15-1189-1-1a]OZF21133.1 preprotein translocase [Rhodococcus sp. 14-2686-1-2]
MFGLTFEKLFLVAVIAGFLLGPSRLPGYARKLAHGVRSIRDFVDTTRAEAEQEMGVTLRRSEWESIDLRQYDPRRIVRDALNETITPNSAAPPADALLTEASAVRPGQKYLVTGTSSHPRRILIASLPEDDPRRIAAEVDSVPREPVGTVEIA